jgi:superfamily II DNA/RNA helicase
MPPTFADLGVPADLCALLKRRGIAEPFPIQALTLPDALAGRDICGRAPTGSGKTLAFGLAIAARIGRAEPRRPRALVLTPTRELAAQVAGEIDGLLAPATGADQADKRRSSGARRNNGRNGARNERPSASGRSRQVAAIYGGASYGPQRRALAQGASVVVACPGRLEDLVDQGDVFLDQVDLVVVDEADRMADMGFLPAVRRLLDRTKADRQTLLFSATLDGDIDAIVRRYQRDPSRHEVAPNGEGAGDVEHVFWRAESSQRVELVAELIRRHQCALVFCRTRRGAERVAKQLKASGVASAAIHGNRTQAQRERALASFASGRVSALVATDVAARGIHVDGVACVIHFDLPADSKDYIHRSGRTGRAGASGTVVTLVPTEQRRELRSLQRTLGLPEQLDAPDFITGRTPAPAPAGPSRSTPPRSEDRSNGRRPAHRPSPTDAAARRRRRRQPATKARSRY